MAKFIVTVSLDIEADDPTGAARMFQAMRLDPQVKLAPLVRLYGQCPSCKAFGVHRGSCKLLRKFLVHNPRDPNSGLIGQVYEPMVTS